MIVNIVMPVVLVVIFLLILDYGRKVNGNNDKNSKDDKKEK